VNFGRGPGAGARGNHDERRTRPVETITFDERARRILDGKNFATVATLNPDGGPQSSLVWFMRDGDTVLFSTKATRQKARNLVRDRRISLGVFDIENPYDFVEIRGTAELIDDTNKELSKELSHRYLNEDPPFEPDDVIRLVVRVIPERVNHFAV
jgi:PPOX class probable F420-dependent enzyme